MKHIALITGASSTIGLAIAKKLGENGHPLILHYHNNKQKIDEFKKEHPTFETLVISADLTSQNGLDDLCAKIDMQGWNPTFFIHSIGIADYGLIQDVTGDRWDQLINGMVRSTFFCSQKLIPFMIRQHYGRIINISSIWGQIGAANEVLYSTAKGAIDAFTRSLGKELASTGITVNAIAPGVILSPMIENFSLEEIENLKEEIPARRFLDPKEVAHHVNHLLQPESSYITGQVLRVDGGWY